MNILGIKPTQEEINLIINEYDLDGDGHIDFAEFQQIYISYEIFYIGEDLLQIKNRSNKLSDNSIEMELVC